MVATKKPRLTWRKEPNETVLRAEGQSPRGAILKANGEDVGHVYANMVGWKREQRGWYWVARSDGQPIPLRNTCDKPVNTLDHAKAACEAYVRQCLAGGA